MKSQYFFGVFDLMYRIDSSSACDPRLDAFWRRKVGGCLLVGIQEDLQPQETLPERKPLEHGLLQPREFVVGSSMVPLAAASILLHEADFLGNCRYNLRRAAAIANDRNSLASVVNGMIPAGCVKHGTVKTPLCRGI